MINEILRNYLTKFSTTSEYKAVGVELDYPNVSLTDDTGDVHYVKNLISYITIRMTGGDALVFENGTKGDGTSLQGFILNTGQTIEIIKGTQITVHTQAQDSNAGRYFFGDDSKNIYTQYIITPNQYELYYSENGSNGSTYSLMDNETITFTPLDNITFYADVDL